METENFGHTTTRPSAAHREKPVKKDVGKFLVFIAVGIIGSIIVVMIDSIIGAHTTTDFGTVGQVTHYVVLMAWGAIFFRMMRWLSRR